MQVMIAQLFGVTDVTLLVCIGALMASCMLFGHQMEARGAGGTGGRACAAALRAQQRVCCGQSLMSCAAPPPPLRQVSNGERLTCYEAGGDPRKPPAIALGPDAGLPFITDGVAAAAPLQQAARVDWGPFWMGCWPFVAAVAVTAVYFFEAVSNGDPPTFVWCARGVPWRAALPTAAAASPAACNDTVRLALRRPVPHLTAAAPFFPAH